MSLVDGNDDCCRCVLMLTHFCSWCLEPWWRCHHDVWYLSQPEGGCFHTPSRCDAQKLVITSPSILLMRMSTRMCFEISSAFLMTAINHDVPSISMMELSVSRSLMKERWLGWTLLALPWWSWCLLFLQHRWLFLSPEWYWWSQQCCWWGRIRCLCHW